MTPITPSIPFELTLPVATLGPEGTDADFLASSLSSKVLLHPTFRAALQHACNDECFGLVACGCMSSTETWVDLHFEFLPYLKILHVFAVPTKPMCLAANFAGAKDLKSIAVYPAVRQLARGFSEEADLIECPNKPAAVEACVAGLADACIGSEDVIRQKPGLVILNRIEATMVWVLYGNGNLALRLSSENKL